MYEFKYVHYEFDILNHKGFSNFTTLKFSCIFVTFKVLCEKKFNGKGRDIYGPFTRDFTNRLSPGCRDFTRGFITPK